MAASAGDEASRRVRRCGGWPYKGEGKSDVRHDALMVLSAAIILWGAGAGEVRAQTDLNAGKSGAQMFASNCAACHHSPAGLARGRSPRSVANFLLEHYTARPQNAGAIASYLVSVRGTAPPARATNPTEPGALAVRHRPLEKINAATVERLKSFASAADAAVPSDPNAPPRGIERLEAYAATGTAPGALRQTAITAALREARAKSPAQSALPGAVVAPPSSGRAAEGTPAAVGLPAATEDAAVLQLRGPPATGARPSLQSNDDQF
jgi:hypothetical protein